MLEHALPVPNDRCSNTHTLPTLMLRLICTDCLINHPLPPPLSHADSDSAWDLSTGQRTGDLATADIVCPESWTQRASRRGPERRRRSEEEDERDERERTRKDEKGKGEEDSGRMEKEMDDQRGSQVVSETKVKLEEVCWNRYPSHKVDKVLGGDSGTVLGYMAKVTYPVWDTLYGTTGFWAHGLLLLQQLRWYRMDGSWTNPSTDEGYDT